MSNLVLKHCVVLLKWRYSLCYKLQVVSLGQREGVLVIWINVAKSASVEVVPVYLSTRDV